MAVGEKEGECGALSMNGSDNKCPQSWVDLRKERHSYARSVIMESESARERGNACVLVFECTYVCLK